VVNGFTNARNHLYEIQTDVYSPSIATSNAKSDFTNGFSMRKKHGLGSRII